MKIRRGQKKDCSGFGFDQSNSIFFWKFSKGFYTSPIVYRIMRTDNALALISKHKQLIIVVIGIAAIASYMIPFANLFAVADASSDAWKKTKKVDLKKKKFDFKFAKFFQKLFFKKLQIIDNSERTTNIFKNFGVNIERSFTGPINTIDVYSGLPGGTTNGGLTTPVGSSIALNQGSNYFFVLVQNCPAAAGSGSGSTSTASTSCTQNPTFNIQTNNYATFGGSV